MAEIADVIDDPQLRHRGQIIEIEHPEAGKIPMHGFIARLSDTDLSVRSPVPTAGQHTEEILNEWIEYDHDRVVALKADDVI